MIKTFILSSFLLLTRLVYAQDSSVVYFAFDQHALTTASKKVLDSITAKPYLSVSIYGHTDQYGSNEYNARLSERRANAVKDHLLAKGVDISKINIVKGYGEEWPVVNKLDATSRQANRRVVVVTVNENAATSLSPIPDTVIVDSPMVEKPVRSVTPSTPSSKPEKLLEKIIDTTTKEGQNIILKHINFYGGRHVFLPEAYPALMELLEVMQTIPTLEIEIQGHICCKDDESDGLDLDTGQPFLSYNRARAVYEFLTRRGIDPKRMKYRGYGHRFPIIEVERTEEERTTNRRVEIKILKK